MASREKNAAYKFDSSWNKTKRSLKPFWKTLNSYYYHYYQEIDYCFNHTPDPLQQLSDQVLYPLPTYQWSMGAPSRISFDGPNHNANFPLNDVNIFIHHPGKPTETVKRKVS